MFVSIVAYLTADSFESRANFNKHNLQKLPFIELLTTQSILRTTYYKKPTICLKLHW
jgi:hypothetical protein